MEKSISDLKESLDRRLARYSSVPLELMTQIELTTHDLNQRSLRRLRGLTACELGTIPTVA